jgi:hypothetical protein
MTLQERFKNGEWCDANAVVCYVCHGLRMVN